MGPPRCYRDIYALVRSVYYSKISNECKILFITSSYSKFIFYILISSRTTALQGEVGWHRLSLYFTLWLVSELGLYNLCVTFVSKYCSRLHPVSSQHCSSSSRALWALFRYYLRYLGFSLRSYYYSHYLLCM